MQTTKTNFDHKVLSFFSCKTYISAIEPDALGKFLEDPISDNVPQISQKIFDSINVKKKSIPFSKLTSWEKVWVVISFPCYSIGAIFHTISWSCKILLRGLFLTVLVALKIFCSKKYIQDAIHRQYLELKYLLSFNDASKSANQLEIEHLKFKSILDSYNKTTYSIKEMETIRKNDIKKQILLALLHNRLIND